VAQLSARGAAIAALREWRTEKAFADSVISKLFRGTTLSTADRAFTIELFYGILRNLTLLDFWIGRLRTAPVDIDLRDILRLGLYQLFILQTSQHAAVYETVNVARKKHRPLINGVLRTALRRRDELREQARAQPLNIRTSHPKFLVARWERNFGAEATEGLCAWNNQPPSVYARVNQLRTDREEFIRSYPESRPVANNPNFVALEGVPTEALERGYCYIQDPSTAIACRLLDPRFGEKVLDACAAPGGKTGYLAELMKNCGVIVACDRESKRVRGLEENLARIGVEIARVFRHDWIDSRIPSEIASLGPFDRMLIDAPCSNTGVMRRRVDVRWRLTSADFARLQKRQIRIVRAVIPLLKPGGTLVYSTCSLEPEENDEVLEQVLARLSMLHLEEKKQSFPFRDNVDGAFAAKFIRTG